MAIQELINKDFLSVFGQTDIGKNRTNNEDNLLFCPLWDDKHYLAVVIDGVGGYEGGEVAAEIAANEIYSYLSTYRNGECRQLLCDAVNYANNCIVKERMANEKVSSMGCVLSACLIDEKTQQIHIAHVGDTRIYRLYADGSMEKITHDHSLIGYREEIGDLTEEEAMTHPQRNIISRDVGSEEHNVDDPDWIESSTCSVQAGETLLLCSDGLCDMITKSQMAEVIRQNSDIKSRVQGLIDAANQRGGKDNITAIIVEFKENKPATEDPSAFVTTPVDTVEPDTAAVQPKCKKNKTVKRLVALVVFLFLLVIGLLIALLFLLMKGDFSSQSHLPKAVNQNQVSIIHKVLPNDTLKNDSLPVEEKSNSIQ